METVKQCQLCSSLRKTSMSFLLRHLTEVHSSKPGFSFVCGLNKCQRRYQNITTYKHHVYSRHTQTHTNLQLGSNDCSNDAEDAIDDVIINADCDDSADNSDEEVNLEDEYELMGNVV